MLRKAIPEGTSALAEIHFSASPVDAISPVFQGDDPTTSKFCYDSVIEEIVDAIARFSLYNRLGFIG
jgi:hypothetical protein